MLTKEINAAIVDLESQQKHYEELLNKSIANDEIFAKTKLVLRKLKNVSHRLVELKKIKLENI